jgi:nitrate reductase gamma subunit
MCIPSTVLEETNKIGTMWSSMVLKKIMLQLIMHLLVLNACMGLEEGLDHVAIMCWFYKITIGDAPEVLGNVALIFNDHVVQDDATFHYLPKNLRLPVLIMAFDYAKSLMKHTESTLNILPRRLLNLDKVRLFFTNR